MWWLPAALAASPTYSTDTLTLRREPGTAAAARAHLAASLLDEGSPVRPPLAALDDTEVVALFVATSFAPAQAELDITLDGRLVTVWRDLDGYRVASRRGEVRLDRGPSWEDLSTRYQLEGPPSDAARWEPEATDAVARAMRHLSPDVLARVRDVHWERRPAPSDPVHGPHEAAAYIVDGGRARIVVYDATLRSGHRFVGPLERPEHPAVLVLLHELAHAFADAPLRALTDAHERRRLAHADGSAALSREAAALRADTARYNNGDRTHSADALQQRGRELQRRAHTLNAEAAALTDAATRITALNRTAPIAAVFAREVGGAPTAYGATSLDEAFAEAFALFHLDPEALERAQPGATAWFRAGRHLAEP